MAKEPVSARVPPRVADGIDEYAEAWDMSRTDAMTVLLKSALEESPNPREVDGAGELNPAKGVYTVKLTPENADYIEDGEASVSERLNRLVEFYQQF
jgi:hypothetical protein